MPSKKNKKSHKFYDDLKAGMEDIIAYKEGKLALVTDTIYIPDAPKPYTAKQIKKIRGEYTQNIFALILNVSIKTVQSWESGKRTPSHAALRLLEVIERGYYRPEVYTRDR